MSVTSGGNQFDFSIPSIWTKFAKRTGISFKTLEHDSLFSIDVKSKVLSQKAYNIKIIVYKDMLF